MKPRANSAASKSPSGADAGRCTLALLARDLGVSVSTVSLALRGSPLVRADTAEKIRSHAAARGYRPDPRFAALMAHIRRGRVGTTREQLAFVWVEATRRECREHEFHVAVLAGVRAQTERLGFGLAEFWLNDSGMTPQRLSRILRARGIRGVVFSGCSRRTSVDFAGDCAEFAMAVVGNAAWNPELHRAGVNHYLGMKHVMGELAARGYARPAAILRAATYERAHRMWGAAFVQFSPDPPAAQARLRVWTRTPTEGLRGFLRAKRPDVVIACEPQWLALLRPEVSKFCPDCGFVLLSRTADAGEVAGVDLEHSGLGARAVDLVVAQLYRNERGIPREPRQLLITGRWCEGSTLRPVGAEPKTRPAS